MKQLIMTGTVFLLFIISSNASAILIDDTYWGSDDHGWGDRIGDSEYEVYNMDVNIVGDMMTVRVNTNFSTPDAYGVNYGDLFISTDGWDVAGNADNHYLSDDASTGSWEFVFDTSADSLYGGDFSILTSDSDEVFGLTNYIYRNGQEVLRGSGGTAISGSSSVDTSHAGFGGFVEYNILLSSLNLTGDGALGLKWGMTCANDTIEGAVRYTSVPEPASLLLLGIGLLGFGISSRRRTD